VAGGGGCVDPQVDWERWWARGGQVGGAMLVLGVPTDGEQVGEVGRRGRRGRKEGNEGESEVCEEGKRETYGK
jgi:hypothetical protein